MTQLMDPDPRIQKVTDPGGLGNLGGLKTRLKGTVQRVYCIFLDRKKKTVDWSCRLCDAGMGEETVRAVICSNSHRREGHYYCPYLAEWFELLTASELSDLPPPPTPRPPPPLSSFYMFYQMYLELDYWCPQNMSLGSYQAVPSSFPLHRSIAHFTRATNRRAA